MMARSQQVLDHARADLGSLGAEEFVRRYRAQGWQNGELTGVMLKAGLKQSQLVHALHSGFQGTGATAGSRPATKAQPAQASGRSASPQLKAAGRKAPARQGQDQRLPVLLIGLIPSSWERSG